MASLLFNQFILSYLMIPSLKKALGFLSISFPITNPPSHQSHPSAAQINAEPRKAFAQAFQVARGREVNHHRTYQPERDGMGGEQLWWVGGGWVWGFGFALKDGEVLLYGVSCKICKDIRGIEKCVPGEGTKKHIENQHYQID